MYLYSITFYIFSLVAVLSALMVISARNPVHSVLFLILSFVNASGLFVLLGAEFLAMILVVVYVGAVAVLFLFADNDFIDYEHRYSTAISFNFDVDIFNDLTLISVYDWEDDYSLSFLRWSNTFDYFNLDFILSHRSNDSSNGFELIFIYNH